MTDILPTWKRIHIGGLGALTPTVLNLVTIDATTILTDFNWVTFAVFMIRNVALFYLGGVIAYLHKEENKPMKLFELGIVAPALLISLMNASNITPSKGTTQIDNVSIFSSVAYAADIIPKIHKFNLPEEDFTTKVLRGLGKIVEPKNSYVVLSSYKTEKEVLLAKSQIEKILSIETRAFAPNGKVSNYSLVYGDITTISEANKILVNLYSQGTTTATIITLEK